MNRCEEHFNSRNLNVNVCGECCLSVGEPYLCDKQKGFEVMVREWQMPTCLSFRAVERLGYSNSGGTADNTMFVLSNICLGRTFFPLFRKVVHIGLFSIKEKILGRMRTQILM